MSKLCKLTLTKLSRLAKLPSLTQLCERPALGLDHQLFFANTTKHPVFIHQQGAAALKATPGKAASPLPWIPPPLASLDEAGFRYTLVSTGSCQWGFTEIQKAIQQRQLSAITPIYSLFRLIQQIHQAGYILGELTAEALYWSENADKACLVNSRFASLISAVHRLQLKSELDIKTLRALAPEATGRVNCPLDQRADLYAAGVISYALLAGHFPFEQQQALALIHAHIAIAPTPLTADNSDPRLSTIIHTLLQKDPHQRYQSVAGVLHDLERCLHEADTAQHDAFSPALNLGINQLAFADTLYERDYALVLLEQTLAQTEQAQQLQVVAVQGYSGAGKTSVIAQLHPLTLNRHTFFIQGKHDQFLQNSVFSGLIAALEQLAELILQLPTAQLAQWQQQLQHAAAADGQLLTELIPLWQPILQSVEASDASPLNQQSRFNQLLLRLFRVFAAQECNLVLFLDDMQWADRATLRWLELLASDKDNGKRILLLLSYRSNEVNQQHPLHFTMQALEQSAAQLYFLSINPLSEQATIQLLADTLRQEGQSLQSLAQMLIQKTSGNPFYLKQFLLKLFNEKQLYCQADGIWHWDLNAIAKLNLSDNHAEMIAQRLDTFSPEVQQQLKLVALLGDVAEIDMLSAINQQSSLQTERQLTEPINAGILTAFTTTDGQHLAYVQFSHDRLQQAAFQLNTPLSEQQLHAAIADYYLSQLSPTALQQQIFAVIVHLNAALPLMLPKLGANNLIELNLLAAQKALSTNAYDSAQAYFEQARQLQLTVPEHDNWLNIYRGLAQSHYLTQQYQEAWHCCLQAEQHSNSLLQRMQICQQKILILFAQNKLAEAFALAAIPLAELHINITDTQSISSRYAELLTLYDADNITGIRQNAALKDAELLQAMDMLGSLFTVAYIVGPLHYMTVTYQLVKLSLQQGHSAASALGYLGHGMNLVAAFNQHASALEFADLALNINQQFKGRFQATLHFQRAAAILPWNAPLQNSIQALDDSLQQALHDGNLEYAAHSALFASFYRVLSGLPLEQVQQHGERAIQFLVEKQFPYNLEFCQIWQQFALNLSGSADEVLQLEGSAFRESRQLPILQQDQNLTILFCYHSIKMMLAYLMEDDAQALKHLKAAEPLAAVALSLYHQTEFYFFAALTYARLLKHSADTDNEQSISWREQLDSNLKQFELWSQSAAANHQHKVLLLKAELCSLNKPQDAWLYYQQAIDCAEQQGFIQHLAIAHERAADHWQQLTQPDYALAHRRKAYLAYQHWQADAKLAQLQNKYPQISSALPSVADSTGWQLDLASIFKASATLSIQVDLAAFLDTMLHIMVENAGAQDGCLLFLNTEHDLHLQASSRPDLALPPDSLLNLVRRSGKVKLVNDSQQQSWLQAMYTEQTLPASVLCIPIVVHGEFRGILYLQHESLAGAFPQERVQVLQLLANQTAMLFENTRLSQQLLEANKNLEQKVALRTRELAQAKLKAEAATDAKSAFLARMSHEIRTPINAVIGLSRLASKRVADDEQLDVLHKIRDSGEMLLSLVNDILDFSKVEAGKLSLEHTRFSVLDVVQQALNMTALKAHSKGLELVADISVDIPEQLLGDPLRIQQLLINLLNNAVKFTEKGSICISLHGQKQDDKQYQLHGSVTDTGIGMTEQQQQRLFQSFAQGDDSITRKYGGSGLGLTICKQLCELMSGDIWLESEAGYGSTFYFSLNVQLPEHYQAAYKRRALSSGKLKALVVDDMALTRMVLLKQLDELGIQAEQTNNGLEAISKVQQAEAQQQPYDVILMDWRMPQLDGIETSRRIQQQLGSRSPHILMVSAYDKVAARTEMQQVNIKHFLEKPVNYAMLLEALMPLIYKAQQHEQQDAQGQKRPSAYRRDTWLQQPAPDLSGKRLLLVEDHQINRQVALGFLQETGAVIDIALNGADAIKQLQQQQYDLVLMDIQMPEMDGLTASQHIRQQLQLTELPIVAMTAHALAEDIEKSRAAGMNAHLTKPIVAEQLYLTLQQQLQLVLHPTPAVEIAQLKASDADITPLSLDEAQARANLGSQAGLYPSLLHIFLNEHKHLPEQLEQQLQFHDYPALTRGMHSLKAAAAYIGAFAFARQCAKAESALLAGQLDAHDISELITLLRQLLIKLEQQDNQNEQAAEAPIQGPQLELELRQLLPLLQQSDFAAESKLARLTKLTAASEYAADIAKLSHNVSEVEFELACQHLQALLDDISAVNAGSQQHNTQSNKQTKQAQQKE